MDSFKAFLLLSFCLQLSEGFTWISSSISTSSCEGKNINITWEYTLDSGESVRTAQWRKDNGAGGTISVANFFGGSFIESSNYIRRLNRIGDAGLEIKNATSADSGIYYFIVTRNTSITNSTNATVSVHVNPNISCMPVTEKSSENSFTCKIPDECPGRNSIKAIWDDGSVGVLTCLSVSKNYKCCAEGDPVTNCYNGSLCTEIECKAPPTTTKTTTTERKTTQTLVTTTLVTTSITKGTTQTLVTTSTTKGIKQTTTSENNRTDNRQLALIIGISVGVLIVLIIVIIVIYCCKKRNKGRNSRKKQDANNHTKECQMNHVTAM